MKSRSSLAVVLAGCILSVAPAMAQPATAVKSAGPGNAHSSQDEQSRLTQQQLEALALKLMQSPKVQAAVAQTRSIFLAAPEAQTPAGKASLENAQRQHAYAAAQLATNNDPHHPRVLVISQYAHELAGQAFPAALHGGLENPDNVYRIIPISSDSRYVLKGLRHKPGPAQVTYELMDSVPGVSSIGKQIALLKDVDMQVAPDGSFTITIDTDPADGRPNHIRSTPEARALFIRDTLSDWATQLPDHLEIARTDGPQTPLRSEQAMIEEAAALAPGFAGFWIDFRKHYLEASSHRSVNALDTPEVRTGGWGFISGARFEIGDDEALAITVHPFDARYHGVLLGDPWWVGMEAGRHLGSLNTSQARANADGTYTYVVAAKDPGVHNWLDTGGLYEGYVQVRWQGLAPSVTSAAGAIREVRLLKLAELKANLPKDTVWMTKAQREAQLEARYASYRRRLSAD